MSARLSASRRAPETMRTFEHGETESGRSADPETPRDRLAASLARIAVSRREHGATEDGGARNPAHALTRDELYAEARRLDIPGRSKMSKRALERALGR